MKLVFYFVFVLKFPSKSHQYEGMSFHSVFKREGEPIIQNGGKPPSKRPFYVKLEMTVDGRTASCGAALVEWDKIVTALHCVCNTEGQSGETTFNFEMGDFEAGNTEKFSQVKGVVLPEGLGSTCPSGVSNVEAGEVTDIAVIELAESLEDVSSSDIGTLPICQDGEVETDKLVLVGMGLDQCTEGQEGDLTDVPFDAYVVEECELGEGFDSDSTVCIKYKNSADGPEGGDKSMRVSKRDDQTVGCPGDSGSPLFMSDGSEERKPRCIFGVTSLLVEDQNGAVSNFFIKAKMAEPLLGESNTNDDDETTEDDEDEDDHTDEDDEEGNHRDEGDDENDGEGDDDDDHDGTDNDHDPDDNSDNNDNDDDDDNDGDDDENSNGDDSDDDEDESPDDGTENLPPGGFFPDGNLSPAPEDTTNDNDDEDEQDGPYKPDSGAPDEDPVDEENLPMVDKDTDSRDDYNTGAQDGPYSVNRRSLSDWLAWSDAVRKHRLLPSIKNGRS